MTRILVVEDDEQVRTMLCMTLRQAGYETLEADSGRSAREVQARQPADLVVTDIIMPEEDGLETIMHFRKNYPRTRLIAISGGGRVDARDFLKDAQLLGAAVTFQKPVDRRQLLGAVRDLLGETKRDDQSAA